MVEGSKTMKPEMISHFKKQLSFEDWWKNIGSALRPLDCEDMETHAYRVSKIAWTTAINDLNEFQKHKEKLKQ